MNTYRIELTEDQVNAINHACEIVARLKSGQWSMAIESCRDKNGEYIYDWDLIKQVETIIKEEMGLAMNQSWGVGHFEDSDILWDIHQVLRHQISWEYAIKNGYVNSIEDERNWNKMPGVNYDTPMQFSKSPLIKIKKIENKQ